MSTFKFLHAADLHLDSPLLGLASKSPDFAQRVEDASRQALDNLVALAIAEGCSFVVLAGDVFDGELRNVRAGLFFVSRMRRLQEAGIEVFMVLGNHDAENKFVSKLSFSDNVHVFSTRRAETRHLDVLDVSIHGRSFPQRDVLDNIAREYPPPVAGRFNIGLLHTACEGREGYHARYAPCTLEQLVNHGYDYWALGHVHSREVLNVGPHVVYPGNLQGRNPRETGAKGATLVEVRDGEVANLEHHSLDVVRWAQIELDISTSEDTNEVLACVRQRLETAVRDADGRALAFRLTLSGATPLHGELLVRQDGLHEEVSTLCAGIGDDVWMERLRLVTRSVIKTEGLDASIAGQIEGEIRSLPPASLSEKLEKKLAEVATKMPASARMEELFERLRQEAPARAVDLAAALLSENEDADAL